MRTALFNLILILVSVNISAQTEKAVCKTIADRFEYNYNTSKYDSIFPMFSTDMQKSLPLNKTIDFLTGLKSQAGQITKRQFVKYETGTYASYKTNFERAFFLVNISIDNNAQINGLFVKPFTSVNLPMLVRNSTKLNLPFKDEWTVLWGGDTKELNYHVENQGQKNAFDMLIKDAKGNSFKTEGKTNEDYYAFGKGLSAPCNGEVVLVIDGVKDNSIGETNSFNVGGNMIIIKTSANKYLVFCHFKHRSIVVKEGQVIKQGQLLGLCGNSGHSSEPHLHFHIQNDENMQSATGAKCYFDKLIVNGQLRSDYSPIKNDKIKSITR